jgi:Fic family protein
MDKIKMTKKTAFALAQDALNTIDTDEARIAWDVIQKEIDRLDRVALKAKSGETKADKAKAEFRAQILDYITEQGGAYRAGEIAMSFGVSTQKASAALNALVADGALTKVDGEKRTVKFALADAE